MQTPSLVFSAAEEFGLSITNGTGRQKRNPKPELPTQLPPPTEGYVTMVVPQGLTLAHIRGSKLGLEHLDLSQEWYTSKAWYNTPLPAGIWLFRTLTDSFGKRTDEIRALMVEKEDFPHPALALAVALCLRHRRADPLRDRFLTVCADAPESIIQLGTRGQRMVILTYRDLGDNHSLASAAMLMP